MRTMLAGLTGWARMEDGRSQTVRTLDMGITVLGTLLLAVSWTILHSAR